MCSRSHGVTKLCVLLAALLLSSIRAFCTEADARAEVAAALYAASATQAASGRVADAKLRAQRKEIEQLRAKINTSATETASLRSELATAQENYVAELAERDRTYREEISVFRSAVQDIASTPEGAAALARFNAGDEVGALSILDDLTRARDEARQKREQIEAAADRHRTAMLALDARAKGKVTTAQATARFEEVTRLDPGVHSDWVVLGRLYQNAGRLSDALLAARHAAETARSERDKEVALGEMGDVQRQQGDLSAAQDSYRKALAIAKTLADRDPHNIDLHLDLLVSNERVGDVQARQGDLSGALDSYHAELAIALTLAGWDPSNTDWQRRLSVSYEKMGNVRTQQGDLLAALAFYRKALSMREKLAGQDPGNTDRQRDLSVSYEKLGNVQAKQGDLSGALDSYRKELSIREKLAGQDPGNAQWQRDLVVSLIKVGTTSKDKSYLQRALDVVQSLKNSGKLAPADNWMVDDIRRMVAQ